jgi:hypothetical protein
MQEAVWLTYSATLVSTETQQVYDGVGQVLERWTSFNRLGALRGEGGERAFRGWLVGGFLQRTLGWPWDRIVFGESIDLLLLDWQDIPRIYIETKTPAVPLRVQQRQELAPRLGRWTSLRYAVLTNGLTWERFDLPEGLDMSTPTAGWSLADGPGRCAETLGPLAARDYLP